MTTTHYDADTKIWSGYPQHSQPDARTNVASVLLEELALDPDHIGQISVHNDVRQTNRELREASVRLAINLRRSLGAKAHDVIAVIAKNHETMASVMIASLALGAPLNLLEPSFKFDEIVHMLRLTQPKFLFCDSDTFVETRAALQHLKLTAVPIITIDRPVEGAQYLAELLVPSVDEDSFVPLALEDSRRHAAFIVCSSGSTGKPKGVTLSHALIFLQFCEKNLLLKNCIALTFTAFSGSFTLLSGIMNGYTRIISIRSFEPKLALQIIERYGVQFFYGPPSSYAQIIDCPKISETNMSTFKLGLCAGSSTSDELIRRYKESLQITICVAYGMSEIGGPASLNVPGLSRPNSVGLVKPVMSVCIRNEDETHCGPLVDGEICVRPIVPALGYWGDAEATASSVDADGWVASGDIGHFDNDGYLYVVDRKKDILKYCGNQISPSELECVLRQCDGVSEVCVFGIEDTNSGDLAAAAIVQVAGHPVTPDDIHNFIKEKLSDSKQLRGGVYFVDDFPMTPSGKVVRRKVKEIIMEKTRKNSK